jgi:hypothetical protein
MQKVQILDKTFGIQLSEKKWRSALKWASVNVVFLSLIFYDAQASDFRGNTWYYIECAACVILSLSFVTNILTFIYHYWFTDKIICDNEAQRILLNLSNNSIVKTPTKSQTPSEKQNDTMQIRNLSYQTYSERKFLKSDPDSVLERVLHLSFSKLASGVNAQQLDEQHIWTVHGSNIPDEPRWKRR